MTELASNSSNLPTLALPKPNPFAYIDFVSRSYSCLIHILYFLYVALKKNSELRLRSCLFLHNINLVTLLIAILYVIYIPVRSPSFADPILNDILCNITEYLWSLLKYCRVFSLLLLAVYRYIACMNVQLYKRINSRLRNLYAQIIGCWLISLLIPLIFKFSLGTTYSPYYCLDGYAPNRLDMTIIYYVFNTILSSFLPTIVIIILYIKIFKKLKVQTTRLSGKSAKLAKFAKQFIVINGITAFATVFANFVEFISVLAVSKFILIHLIIDMTISFFYIILGISIFESRG